MARKLLCSMVVMLMAVGFVFAEELSGRITKVDGDKITFQQTKGGGKGKAPENVGEPITLTVAKDAKILKGKVSFKDKKISVEPGDAIEGGLKAEVFTKIGEKGLNARVTTDDKKTASQVLVITFGGKKKKDAK